jgi:hypothetical protein
MRENPDAYERAYMARQLVQCTLPHSDPGNVPVWSRTNGDLTLAVRPYVDPKTRKALYPYGTIPRLLLFWMVTEATQTKSNRIELGNSLDEFIRAIGLNPRTGGGKRSDAKRLHSQMTRLFRAVISFEDRWPGGISYVDMQIAPRGMLWWSPKKSGETTLMENWVELGEDFYKAITAAPVPVDLRALRALKRSPLALDLYALLAYRTWTVNRKRAAASIPWEGLHAQMGGEYTRLRDFKTKVIEALRRIRLVYPDVRVETTPEGLTIHPAKTPIPAKNTVDGIR